MQSQRTPLRRPWRRAGLAAIAALFAGSSAAAAATRGAPPPDPVREGRAVSVSDGDTLTLESGVEVRLVGIQAPKLPLGRPGFRTWPLAPEAKAALEQLALGRRLSLWYGGRTSDRYGRLLAHLTTPDGVWVQGELLRRGLARVYTFADNRARAAEMLSLEAGARAARRGIWRLAWYRVLTPATLERRHLGTFQLVEGRVLAVAVRRGRGYLNFGRNWRTDFTVTISPRDLRRLWPQSAPLAGYAQRMVRVRGWLRSRNGPMIEATHPEQIELLP